MKNASMTVKAAVSPMPEHVFIAESAGNRSHLFAGFCGRGWRKRFSGSIIIRKKFSEEDESHAPEKNNASLPDSTTASVLRDLSVGGGEDGEPLVGFASSLS
jgi:hypothetical protein